MNNQLVAYFVMKYQLILFVDTSFFLCSGVSRLRV